jgi:hypothetical protein
MFIKIHKSYRTVVALADKDIIGKTFSENHKHLHIRPSFFQGKEITEEEAIEVLKKQVLEDATFNIVGEKAVRIAKKAGIIKEANIAKVQNIPFALVLI